MTELGTHIIEFVAAKRDMTDLYPQLHHHYVTDVGTLKILHHDLVVCTTVI